MNVGNLISGSSAFSKSSLNICKFMVHILLRPSLENFQHCFASVWNECNCVVVCTFFGILLSLIVLNSSKLIFPGICISCANLILFSARRYSFFSSVVSVLLYSYVCSVFLFFHLFLVIFHVFLTIFVVIKSFFISFYPSIGCKIIHSFSILLMAEQLLQKSQNALLTHLGLISVFTYVLILANPRS